MHFNYSNVEYKEAVNENTLTVNDTKAVFMEPLSGKKVVNFKIIT